MAHTHSVYVWSCSSYFSVSCRDRVMYGARTEQMYRDCENSAGGSEAFYPQWRRPMHDSIAQSLLPNEGAVNRTRAEDFSTRARHDGRV